MQRLVVEDTDSVPTFANVVAAGNAALGSQDTSQRLLLFQRAKVLHPTHALPYIMLGVIMTQIGQLEWSERQYETAINLLHHAHNAPYSEAAFFIMQVRELQKGSQCVDNVLDPYIASLTLA
jgi:Flp pilus assembly protein TadD